MHSIEPVHTIQKKACAFSLSFLTLQFPSIGLGRPHVVRKFILDNPQVGSFQDAYANYNEALGKPWRNSGDLLPVKCLIYSSITETLERSAQADSMQTVMAPRVAKPRRLATTIKKNIPYARVKGNPRIKAASSELHPVDSMKLSRKRKNETEIQSPPPKNNKRARSATQQEVDPFHKLYEFYGFTPAMYDYVYQALPDSFLPTCAREMGIV